MSLKAIKEAVCDLKRRADALGDDAAWNLALLAEQQIAALEKAATDADRLGMGDFIYNVRDTEKVRLETPKDGNTWDHPDVKAWSDAAQLLITIAKESE
jgi:hypothetical protein